MLNSNLTADHWLPAPGYDLLAAAPNKAIQIYSANPNILAAQGVPEGLSQYGTYVCYGKCEYPTFMYIDVFGEFGAYGRETKRWENYSALETFDITPVAGINAGMSLKIKNGILYSKVWVTLPNMSEWSSCAICTVSG